MRVIMQKVTSASVSKDSQIVSKINSGVVLYIGFEVNDTIACVYRFIENLKSIIEEKSEILMLSQFTLLAMFKGSKPSFHKAAENATAKEYFYKAIEEARVAFPGRIQTGIFGEHLEIKQVFEKINIERIDVN
ncbi:hypothetical protein GINT2_002109 [Glugoides intestinalis]